MKGSSPYPEAWTMILGGTHIVTDNALEELQKDFDEVSFFRSKRSWSSAFLI